MSGNLISSGTDTDLRIGMVAVLSLAIVVSLAAVLSHRATAEGQGTVVLSASTPEIIRTVPEIVRSSPSLVAQRQNGMGAEIE